MRAPQTRLRLTRLIRAPRQQVYDAWTQPQTLQKWFCPADLRPGAVEADVRVGGAYRGSMHDVEIVPGEKLVFTHGWEGPERAETLVTVELRDKDGGTELTLTHERFVDPDVCQGHAEGWALTLDNLTKHLAQEARR
jgi:uncharacterized protein YndB with AHSA1/START domain